jgi:hypothetical protein
VENRLKAFPPSAAADTGKLAMLAISSETAHSIRTRS